MFGLQNSFEIAYFSISSKFICSVHVFSVFELQFVESNELFINIVAVGAGYIGERKNINVNYSHFEYYIVS